MKYVINKNILFLLLILILIILFFYLKPNTESFNIYFSKISGFYDEDFYLEIKGKGRIYYTLDGSIPTKQSNLYTGPIHITDASNSPNTNSMNKDVSPLFDSIDENGLKQRVPEYLVDKCNVVRAVSFLKDGNKTDVISASYFVGFKNKEEYKNIGIISLITDSKNLFDEKKGIYVTGNNGKNYNFMLKGKAYEREAYIDVFDKNKDLILQKNIGIRIHGNATRRLSPKSLNIYFRDNYDKINDFYGNIIDENYNPKALTLLYPSTDYTRMKDFLVMSLYSNKNVATMKFKPYLLFLDGEYWGFYYLTEKYNKNFIAYHYKIKNKKDIVVAKTEDDIFFKFGLDTVFSFFYNTDFSQEANYNTLCNIVDIDSFIEYIAVLTYIGRMDGINDNCGVWKTIKTEKKKYQNGKLYFMLYDMDDICNESKNSDVNMILSLMNNKQFKEKLYNEFMRLSKLDFNPTLVERFIKTNKEYIKKYVVNDYKRFYGINEQEGNKIFYKSVDTIISFFKNRPNKVLEIFKEN